MSTEYFPVLHLPSWEPLRLGRAVQCPHCRAQCTNRGTAKKMMSVLAAADVSLVSVHGSMMGVSKKMWNNNNNKQEFHPLFKISAAQMGTWRFDARPSFGLKNRSVRRILVQAWGSEMWPFFNELGQRQTEDCWWFLHIIAVLNKWQVCVCQEFNPLEFLFWCPNSWQIWNPLLLSKYFWNPQPIKRLFEPQRPLRFETVVFFPRSRSIAFAATCHQQPAGDQARHDQDVGFFFAVIIHCICIITLNMNLIKLVNLVKQICSADVWLYHAMIKQYANKWYAMTILTWGCWESSQERVARATQPILDSDQG